MTIESRGYRPNYESERKGFEGENQFFAKDAKRYVSRKPVILDNELGAYGAYCQFRRSSLFCVDGNGVDMAVYAFTPQVVEPKKGLHPKGPMVDQTERFQTLLLLELCRDLNLKGEMGLIALKTNTGFNNVEELQRMIDSERDRLRERVPRITRFTPKEQELPTGDHHVFYYTAPTREEHQQIVAEARRKATVKGVAIFSGLVTLGGVAGCTPVFSVVSAGAPEILPTAVREATEKPTVIVTKKATPAPSLEKSKTVTATETTPTTVPTVDIEKEGISKVKTVPVMSNEGLASIQGTADFKKSITDEVVAKAIEFGQKINGKRIVVPAYAFDQVKAAFDNLGLTDVLLSYDKTQVANYDGNSIMIVPNVGNGGIEVTMIGNMRGVRQDVFDGAFRFDGQVFVYKKDGNIGVIPGQELYGKLIILNDNGRIDYAQVDQVTGKILARINKNVLADFILGKTIKIGDMWKMVDSQATVTPSVTPTGTETPVPTVKPTETATDTVKYKAEIPATIDECDKFDFTDAVAMQARRDFDKKTMTERASELKKWQINQTTENRPVFFASAIRINIFPESIMSCSVDSVDSNKLLLNVADGEGHLFSIVFDMEQSIKALTDYFVSTGRTPEEVIKRVEEISDYENLFKKIASGEYSTMFELSVLSVGSSDGSLAYPENWSNEWQWAKDLLFTRYDEQVQFDYQDGRNSIYTDEIRRIMQVLIPKNKKVFTEDTYQRVLDVLSEDGIFLAGGVPNFENWQ